MTLGHWLIGISWAGCIALGYGLHYKFGTTLSGEGKKAEAIFAEKIAALRAAGALIEEKARAVLK